MPHEQIGDGRLSLAAPPHERHAFARTNAQRHTVEHGNITIERERHIVEYHIAAHRIRRHRPSVLLDFRGRVENLVHPPERHGRHREARVEAHHPLNGTKQSHLIGNERDECAHRDGTVDHAIPAHEKHGGAAE